MLNSKSLVIFISVMLLTLVSGRSVAMDGSAKGLIISKEAKARDTGWGDSTCSIRMILKNAEGQESVRTLEFKSLEVDQDGDKSFTIFNQPQDIKGTKFLSFSHPTAADDQWLYLPSLRRVKRISSNNKSGPFMGSEFSYEDLSSFEIEKYTYKYLGDDVINNLDSFKVEQHPTYENSGYSRRIVWLDKLEYRIQRIEFYDRKDTLLKTLIYNNYQLFLGKFWRPTNASIVNHQSGKSTELVYTNYAFKTGLDNMDFNQNALKRVR